MQPICALKGVESPCTRSASDAHNGKAALVSDCLLVKLSNIASWAYYSSTHTHSLNGQKFHSVVTKNTNQGTFCVFVLAHGLSDKIVLIYIEKKNHYDIVKYMIASSSFVFHRDVWLMTKLFKNIAN